MPCRRSALALAAGLLLLVPALPGAPAATPDAEVPPQVDRRFQEWWPRAQEKQFDRIGWAADIRTARRLAAAHDRPVFLFTMDGRVNLGRC